MAPEALRLVKDIHVLIAVMQLDFRNLSRIHVNEAERDHIASHVDWCVNELNDLIEHMRGEHI